MATFTLRFKSSTSARNAIVGVAGVDETVLFTLTPSPGSSVGVSVSCSLPGAGELLFVPAKDEESTYSIALRRRAMDTACDIWKRWLTEHVGLNDVRVEAIDES